MKETVKIILFISFFAIFSILYYHHNNCVTGQDALTFHLPVTRYIAENLKLPEYVPNHVYYYGKMTKPPLLYIIAAPIFILFGISDCVAHIVPFLLTMITLLVLFAWNKKLGGKSEVMFAFLIFSMQFIIYSLWFYQEAPTILFSTLFFYFLYEWYVRNKKIHIYTAIVFASLTALSKISGYALVFVSFWLTLFLFVKKRDIKPLLFFTIISAAPVLWWFSNKLTVVSVVRIAGLEFGIPPIQLPFMYVFPFLLLPFVKAGLITKKEFKYFFLWITLMIYFFSVSISSRYLSPFYSVPLVFSSVLFSKIISKYKTAETFIKTSVMASFVLFLLIMIIQTPFTEIHYKKVVMFAREHYPHVKSIAVDTDFGFGWWADYEVIPFMSVTERYNLTMQKFVDMFNITLLYDSWWDYCNVTNGRVCESDWLENVSLKLVYDDGKNKLYEVVR